ncbi:MAG TPA: SPASM domain-containing protein, partial [Tepidisphaeraceae bacterium]
GDPLLHPHVVDIVRRLSAVAAVSVETDLLTTDLAFVSALAASGADVVAVHLPAMTPVVYRDVMGVDGMTRVVENIQRLLEARQRLASGTPLVVPLFTKLLANFDEMEHWYDTWLRAIGSAVIVGPTAFGGRISGIDVADMTPPVRRPCARLSSRITILSDGRIVACEQDAFGEHALGRLGDDRIADVWQGPQQDLRAAHGRLAQLPDLCNRCKEWHRP